MAPDPLARAGVSRIGRELVCVAGGHPPTPFSWEQGDQEVVCSAYDLDLNKLTDTVKNSRA